MSARCGHRPPWCARRHRGARPPPPGRPSWPARSREPGRRRSGPRPRPASRLPRAGPPSPRPCRAPAPVTTATGLTTVTSAPTRPQCRSRTRASRSACPSSALAPVGSPSTPLDDTGRTPSARRRGSSVAIGSVRPGSASSRRTAPGSIASSKDVSVRPACASPPGVIGSPHEHVVTFGRTATLDRHERLLVAAVGVDEDHAGEGAAGGAHELDEELGQDRVADEERAREVGVLAAGPVGHGGRHGDAAPARRQSRRHGAGDAGVGVEGEVRPVLLERAQRDRQHCARPGRLHLGPGGAGELHALRCGPASGSGRAWAPASGSRPGATLEWPSADCGRASSARQRGLAVPVHALGVRARRGAAR